MTGLDDQETKTAAYWSTPFKTICLGMNVSGDLNWLGLNMDSTSLHSLIARGQFINSTTTTRADWKDLIAESSLQINCNKRGINVICNNGRVYARIGILSDNSACDGCDSGIVFGGFGKKYKYCNQPEPNICGNFAGCGGDNGDKNIKAIGYILVR